MALHLFPCHDTFAVDELGQYLKNPGGVQVFKDCLIETSMGIMDMRYAFMNQDTMGVMPAGSELAQENGGITAFQLQNHMLFQMPA